MINNPLIHSITGDCDICCADLICAMGMMFGWNYGWQWDKLGNPVIELCVLI